MLVLCGLVSAEGFGFSVLPQSGQANLLALANAVCLVFGVWQVQCTPDIPFELVRWCCFWLGFLCPNIPTSEFSVPTASSCWTLLCRWCKFWVRPQFYCSQWCRPWVGKDSRVVRDSCCNRTQVSSCRVCRALIPVAVSYSPVQSSTEVSCLFRGEFRRAIPAEFNGLIWWLFCL